MGRGERDIQQIDVRAPAMINVRAPAKINPFLSVRGRGEDGYHDLVSVMQSVSLYDLLQVELDRPLHRDQHPSWRGRMRLELHIIEDIESMEDMGQSSSSSLSNGLENLALQAALALGERTGVADRRYSLGVGAGPGNEFTPGAKTTIRLSKRIPIAGGMAGGSTDAAATLVALNRLWHCGLDVDELLDLAALLGSDVPFCVAGGTALATGRGTQIARVLCRGTFHWIVGTSADELSTATVYEAWDAKNRPATKEPDAVLAALSSGDPHALGRALGNDLQEVAFELRPELIGKREALLEAGVLGAVVSGSGPTMLGLAADAESAQRIADEVADLFAAVHVATSPAGGPELTR